MGQPEGRTIQAASLLDSKRSGRAPPKRDTRFLSQRRYSNPSVSGAISEATRRAIREVYGYSRLSKIQSATLTKMLEGRDMFAKARTGGGKTLAFLVPCIERAAREATPPPAPGQSDVFSLVISPTQVLATQTDTEVSKLIRFHAGLRGLAVIGGRDVRKDRAALAQGGRIAVLTATPGRLVDHIESTPGFRAAMQGVRTVVLDEADTLLDMGFRAQLDKIFAALSRDRQTVLVSATMPDSVLQLAGRVMRDGFDTIDVVDKDAAVNAQVTHAFRQVSAGHLAHAIAQELRGGDKSVVFFPTNAMTAFVALMFRAAGYDVNEMHGDLNQSHRKQSMDRFRDATRAVMFASDVLARGVDFPNVTKVIQVGVTTAQNYTHRLGRAGRAGMPGEGVLLACDFEAAGMRGVLAQHRIPESPEREVEMDTNIDAAIRHADEGALARAAAQAYRSWVGAYAANSGALKIQKQDVFRHADAVFAGFGLRQRPEIGDNMLQKMGFSPAVVAQIKATRPGAAQAGGGAARRAAARGRTREPARSKSKSRSAAARKPAPSRARAATTRVKAAPKRS
jgi:ATP-dependent RNA helicase MSS116